MTNKKKWCIEKKFNMFENKYKKIHWKIQLHKKVIFGKKNDLQSFSKVIILAPTYKF